MKLLAIESSCDESSVALLENGSVVGLNTKTQTIHRPFGGVVPELAGRSHLELLDKLLFKTLDECKLTIQNLDCFAATVGPGLIGSLLVGKNYTKGLACASRKPFIPIHHLEAHLWSAEIEWGEIPLPFLILLVSGGHSQIVLVNGLRKYEVLGTTIDDALGEAYDKVGKLLNLPFPAGAAIDQLSQSGNEKSFSFSEPLADKSLNFSFSGLKTSFLYQIKKMSTFEIEANKSDLLASFQYTALSSVIKKFTRAAKQCHPKAIVAAGGVAANSRLRLMLSNLSADFSLPLFVPSIKICADNAAMIGYLAFKLLLSKPSCYNETVRPRWPLDNLPLLESAC